MDPFSIGLGVADAGLGIFGSLAGAAGQQQDYLNQKAFQDANSVFAQWQAGFNAKLADANSQYRYWVDTVNYNQQYAYSNQLKNFELIKAIQQAEVVAQTRAAAGAAFVRDSEAISQAYQEAAMQEAVASQQYRWRALQARASVQASEQEGRSVDRLVNDFARQQGDYETLQAINATLRQRQFTREQAGQVAEYLSRWNSQQFYEVQPINDPIAPFPPLPTLIQPSPPSMTGAAPGGGATALSIGTSLLGGVRTAFSASSMLTSLQRPSSTSGPGTPRA